MEFIILFIIFATFYSIFDWIIKKINLHGKLFDRPQKGKYTKSILVVVLILFAFCLQYGKQLLNDLYGKHNYISIILGAFLGSLYINFVPIIFKRNKT